ncbi:MAG: ABC transporter permease [Nitrospirota bacterium]
MIKTHILGNGIIPFKPVFLLTDIAVYLALILFFCSFFYALKRKTFRIAVKHIAGRGSACASFIILLFYVFVGITDSVHFRLRVSEEMPQAATASPDAAWESEVLSLLDYGMTPLRTQTEKSYSAPLAMKAFTEETLEDKSGKKKRVYPRLRYGGSHLESQGEHFYDILRTALRGLFAGIAVTLPLLLVFTFGLSRAYHDRFWLAWKRFFYEAYPIAWRAIFSTVGMLILLLFVIIPLSRDYHFLGTDKVGQDVLYLSLKAIRTGLVIGSLTTLMMLPFAIFFGIGSGYFKGWVDDLISYIYTTLNSVPGVLLIAAAVLILDTYMDSHLDDFTSIAERADLRLFFLCLILGGTGWIGLCRLLRGETLKISELEYIQSAVALGTRGGRIILRHIVPNVMHIVLIVTALEFSGLVLAEAVLSYVGIGVDPAMISWGNMINSARLEMAREPVVWWSLFAALIMMFGLVLSANLFSDALRDALDPRLKGRGIS